MPPSEQQREFVEELIGRPLRLAEQALDVLGLNAALEQAKDAVEEAIRDEMLRATKRWAWLGMPLRIRLTDEMTRPLAELQEFGRREATAELERIGNGGRAFAARDPLPGAGLAGLQEAIIDSLPGIQTRIEDNLVVADLADMSSSAIAKALLAIPGARDIASRVVSSALMSGMAQTFEEAAALVDDVGDGRGGGWEWSAVLDGRQCHPCAEGDGRLYRTWAEAQDDLPNGGPAVVCLGGGRCRCRLVPRPKT